VAAPFGNSLEALNAAIRVKRQFAGTFDALLHRALARRK